jgi:hypothetical protein
MNHPALPRIRPHKIALSAAWPVLPGRLRISYLSVRATSPKENFGKKRISKFDKALSLEISGFGE